MNDDLRNLPLVKAPDSIWTAIETSLDASLKAPDKRPWWTKTSVWTLAAAAIVLALSIGAWVSLRSPKAAWEVVRLGGSVPAHGKLEEGEWLQTNATSRVQIHIGEIGTEIGTVVVEPNSRVRMIASKPGEQRLRLVRGQISASVSAPPRLFFVDTPASTAVDLGCAYTMNADEDGNGLVRVTLGWVSLEWEGRESLVPAGASCRTRPKIGPGTPSFEDAPEALRKALAEFDFAAGGDASVDAVLGEARVRDTLTLWHLLSRVSGGERQRVYNRMVELVALPKGVTPDKALQLDPATLKLWREELAWKW
jgi:hypothetical protein